jgi:hypothetical protein
MQAQTLADALKFALQTNTACQPEPLARPELLLKALRNSTTDRDQIVARRIGIEPTHPATPDPK